MARRVAAALAMKLATLLLAPALLLLAAPPADALTLAPISDCQAVSTSRGIDAVVCYAVVADLSTLTIPPGPAGCATSHPIPTGTAASFAATCCAATASGSTLVCLRLVGAVSA